jgi:hypothetical protein
MASSSTSSLLPTTDREEGYHLPTCTREPSQCSCPYVSWIWADTDQTPVRSGKWMLFPKTVEVDAAWAVVKALLEQGKLGGCAKVAPRQAASENHLICVYTADHDDVTDVMRVLLALRDSSIACAALCILNYKTDDATYAGVYSDTPKHGRQLVSKYTSEKLTGPASASPVTLRLNNIGPDFARKIVAKRAPHAAPDIKFARASQLTGETFDESRGWFDES